jgi:hypothetical protein
MRNKEFWIDIICFFIIFQIIMFIGAKLLALLNLPIFCNISFLGPTIEHCGSLYRLCKGH